MLTFIVGDSELAGRIRAYPWRETALGDPEDWPDSLKTLVSMMLASNQAMYTVWGPSELLLYNDQYISVLQGHHPSALGQPFRQVWSEIAADLAPLVENAYAGIPTYMDDILLVLERRGYTEETHFAYSYTPVFNASGGVDGFYCQCIETTEQVKAAQVIRESEERQAYLLRLADTLRPLEAPEAIMETATRLLRAELSVNRCAYYEIEGDEYVIQSDSAEGVPSLVGRYPIKMFGSGLLDKHLGGHSPIVVENVAETHDVAEREAFAAIQVNAYVGVTLFKQERFVSGLTVHSRVCRAWTSSEVMMVQETAERTWAAVERARAETALSEKEVKYRMLFDSIDEGFCVMELEFGAEGKIQNLYFREVNKAFERLTGLPSALNKSVRELLPNFEQAWIDVYTQVAKTGEPFRIENYVQDVDRWYDTYFSLIGDLGSRYVAVVFQDTTNRKKSEEILRENDERQAFLLRLSDSIRALSDPDEIATTVTRMVAGYFRVDRCFISRISRDEGRAWIEYETRKLGLASAEGEVNLEDFPEVMRIAETATMIFSDVQGDPKLTALDKAAVGGLGLGAFIAAVLRKGKGNYFWDLVIAAEEPREWSATDAPLLEEIAERTWLAMERTRTEKALLETEKLAVVGRLAGSIAHEINNPLEAVTNLLYLIGNTQLPPDAARYLNMAQVELSRGATSHRRRCASTGGT